MEKINMINEKNLNGIGGWLILMAIRMIVAPVLGTFQILDTFFDGFSKINSEPVTKIFNPVWVTYLLVDIIVVFVWIYIAFLFFSKKKSFSIWFIRASGVCLLITIIDSLIEQYISLGELKLSSFAHKDIIKAFISTWIWISYISESKRVKATFIN